MFAYTTEMEKSGLYPIWPFSMEMEESDSNRAVSSENLYH